MSLLARLHNFVGGTPALASEVNDEFNQLVNALNSTSIDKNLMTRYSHASDPPIATDQLGAGLLAQWRQSGVERARVNNDGSFQTSDQFISTVSTGTAPLVVSSTTLVSNLNADTVDGLQGSVFIRKDDTSTQTITSDLILSKNGPQITLSDSGVVANILNDAGFVFFYQTPGQDVMQWDLANAVIRFPQIPVGPGSDPTTGNQLTRKTYVDNLVASGNGGASPSYGNMTVSGTINAGGMNVGNISASGTISANVMVANGITSNGNLTAGGQLQVNGNSIIGSGGTTIKKIVCGGVSMSGGSVSSDAGFLSSGGIIGLEPGDMVFVMPPSGMDDDILIKGCIIPSSNVLNIAVYANQGNRTLGAFSWQYLWIDIT
jgi:hypothetical protein